MHLCSQALLSVTITIVTYGGREGGGIFFLNVNMQLPGHLNSLQRDIVHQIGVQRWVRQVFLPVKELTENKFGRAATLRRQEQLPESITVSTSDVCQDTAMPIPSLSLIGCENKLEEQEEHKQDNDQINYTCVQSRNVI